MELHDLAQASVNAVIAGSLYAIGAIGLTLVFGILRLTNFAHGDMLTLGAFSALWVNVTLDLPLVLGALVAIAVVAAFGVATEFTIWRPLRRRDAGILQMLLMAIGLAITLRYGMLFFAGGGFRRYDIDVTSTFTLAGLRIGQAELAGVSAALVALVATGVLLQRTMIGTRMRALSDNAELAEASGVDTQRTIVQTWLLSGALAGLAGVVAGMLVQVDTNLGWHLLLTLFAAVIVGGIGNVWGAMLGAYLVAFSQEWTVLLINPAYKTAVGFVILVLVLLVRPRGILGRPEAVN